MRKIDIRQGTPEWLEYRKDKRNASEAGNIMGVGFLPTHKFAKIKFLDKPTFTTEAMRNGLEYEDKIRQKINEIYNAHLVPATFCTDDGVYSASLDGYDAELGLICEIKFSKGEYNQLVKHNQPSAKYYAQLQHQMYVMEYGSVIFAAGYIADDFDVVVKHIIVKRDGPYIQKLLKAWDDFYEKYANITDHDIGNAKEVVTDDFTDLSELVKRTNELNQQIQDLGIELENCKKRLIKFANGEDMKIENITISKVIRKPTYDYKAYCDSIKANIGDEFLKDGSETWAVRINKLKG